MTKRERPYRLSEMKWVSHESELDRLKRRHYVRSKNALRIPSSMRSCELMISDSNEIEIQRYEAAERFVNWLDRQLTVAGRGDEEHTLAVEPSGKFWIGRLAPADFVANTAMGDRGDRLEPCAVGIRILPVGDGPWSFMVDVSACAWLRRAPGQWVKTARVTESISVVAHRSGDIG